jgi:hypothetical protein
MPPRRFCVGQRIASTGHAKYPAVALCGGAAGVSEKKLEGIFRWFTEAAEKQVRDALGPTTPQPNDADAPQLRPNLDAWADLAAPAEALQVGLGRRA